MLAPAAFASPLLLRVPAWRSVPLVAAPAAARPGPEPRPPPPLRRWASAPRRLDPSRSTGPAGLHRRVGVTPSRIAPRAVAVESAADGGSTEDAVGGGDGKELYFDGLSYPAEALEWCTTEDGDGAGRCAPDALRKEAVRKLSVLENEEVAAAVRGGGRHLTAYRAPVHPGTRDGEVDDVCGVEAIRSREMLFQQRVDKAFVDTFRQSSPYINAHSGRVFVLHLPGSLIEEDLFGSVMEDIALMRIVGIKLVLVLGPASQIESRLKAEGIESTFINGSRVTCDRVLRIVMEASGNLLFEIESKLARGVVNMPSSSRMSIVTSNFYTAKPLGVIDGDDFGLTGTVRKFDVDAMVRRLDEGDILVLRNIGASPSGQLFNCQSEDVASACAAALQAEKLIFMASGESIYDKRIDKPIPNLTLSSAIRFLDLRGRDLPAHFLRVLETSVRALNKGVTRAHILNRTIDGVLLMEIFHRDGVGLMISRDLYEGIRMAEMDDLLGIEAIIKPLEEKGVLVKRGRATIEQSLNDFIVVERDGMIIACLSLSKMRDNTEWAELGCLAVHPDYRKLGKGDAMLGFTERFAYSKGIRNLFILSTVTFQWFLERGFEEVPVERLPKSRQETYNRKRMSKIYHKKLQGSRAVDEAEILRHVI